MTAAPQQVRFRDYFSPVASWRAQPRWARLLLLLVGLPAALALGGHVFFGEPSEPMPVWAQLAFGVWLVVVVVAQVNVVRVLFRGHW